MNYLERIADKIIEGITFNNLDIRNGYIIVNSPLVKSILQTEIKSNYLDLDTNETLYCTPIHGAINIRGFAVNNYKDEYVTDYYFTEKQLKNISTALDNRISAYKDSINEICLEENDELNDGNTNLFIDCHNLKSVVWERKEKPSMDLLLKLFAGCDNLETFVYRGQPIDFTTMDVSEFDKILEKIDSLALNATLPTVNSIEKLSELYLYDCLILGQEMEKLQNSTDVDEILYHKEMQLCQLDLLRTEINKSRIYVFGSASIYDEFNAYKNPNTSKIISLIDTELTNEEISQNLCKTVSAIEKETRN